MSEEQIVQFLQDNADYMVNNDIVIWLFRTIGWWLAKGLSFLIGIGKDLYNYTFGLVDITSWSGVEEWINEFQPLVMAVLTVSLVALGCMYMFGKNKKHNVLYSILLFGVVVTSSTFLFSTFNEWTVTFKDAVVGDSGVADGTELINSNLYDLLYIDDEIGLANMSDDNRPQYSYLSEEEINYIKMTEVISWDDVDNSDTKDILKKQLLFKNGGASTLKDVSNGVAWTSIGNDLYFRYKFQYFTYYLDALAIILIFFCLAYKNVRITYELFVGRVLATIKAGDLSSQKKMVKILSCIKDQYFALCFTAITIRSFFIFTDYINGGTGGFTRGLVTLFIAFCVIDGSNIMQQITGVDAGLSTVTGKILATTHMIQAAAAGINQHRMLSALKGGENERKRGGSTGDKSSIEGSRIGMLQFGRDNGSTMDKDLAGKNHSATTGNAEARTAMSGQQEQMSGMDGRQEQKKDRNAPSEQANGMKAKETHESTKAMDQELGADKRQSMQQEEKSESTSGQMGQEEELKGASGQMEQMDKDLDGESRYGGYPEADASNPSNPVSTGEGAEVETSRANPENNMFDKWGARYASGESGMYSSSNIQNGTQQFEQEKEKNKSPFKEQHKGDYQKQGEDFSYKRETGHATRNGMGQQEKYQPNETSRKATTFRDEKGVSKAAEAREQKADIKTSENRSAKVTQEKVGKDRYVGGEAVSTKKKQGKPNRWEK